MLSHANMLSIARASLEAVGCREDDEFLSFLPLSHTLERTAGYYLPMIAGARVAFARSATQLVEDLKVIRPTALIAVPRIFERVYDRLHEQQAKGPSWKRRLFDAAIVIGWRRFLRQQRRGSFTPDQVLWPLTDRLVAGRLRAALGGRLRVAVSGGAALSLSVAKLFLALGVPILQGYGLTETSPVLSVNRLDDNRPEGVGPLLPGVEARIAGDGELLVKTPGLMQGYWNNPDATAQVIDTEGWFHTGDQAELRDGHVRITGRVKDILVLSNGEKIPPVDMELAIQHAPHIEQAMIVGEGRAYLAALVVLKHARWELTAKALGLDPAHDASLADARVTAILLGEIKAALKGFPGYAKVRRVRALIEPWTTENGLLTPTLKLKRGKILERHATEVEAMYAES